MTTKLKEGKTIGDYKFEESSVGFYVKTFLREKGSEEDILEAITPIEKFDFRENADDNGNIRLEINGADPKNTYYHEILITEANYHTLKEKMFKNNKDLLKQKVAEALTLNLGADDLRRVADLLDM